VEGIVLAVGIAPERRERLSSGVWAEARTTRAWEVHRSETLTTRSRMVRDHPPPNGRSEYSPHRRRFRS
jgi:hypothetical protein